MTCPVFLARNSGGCGGNAMNASAFPARHRRDVGLDGGGAVGLRDLRVAACEQGWLCNDPLRDGLLCNLRRPFRASIGHCPVDARRYGFLRAASKSTPARLHGTHTQISSDKSTRAPRSEKRPSTLNGATSIGRTGAKYLSADQGHSNATPRPPLVKESRMPCDAVARHTNQNARAGVVRKNRDKHAARPAIIAAKASECVKPRCPKASA